MNQKKNNHDRWCMRMIKKWLKKNKPSIIQHPPMPKHTNKINLGDNTEVSG